MEKFSLWKRKICCQVEKKVMRCQMFVREKILRVKFEETSNQEILRREILMLVLFTYTLYSISSLVLMVVMEPDRLQGEWWIFLVIALFTCSFLVLTLLFFVFFPKKNSLRITSFVFSGLSNVFTFFLVYIQKQPLSFAFAPDYFYFFYLVPIVNLFLSTFSLLWIAVYFINFSIIFVLDIIMANGPIIGDKNEIRLRLGKIYTIYLSISFINIFFISYYVNINEKEKKMIWKIAESVSQLDLENDFIKGLLKRRTDDSKTIEIMKKIVKNFKTYIPFLPDTLKFQVSKNGDEYYQNRIKSLSSSNSKQKSSNSSNESEEDYYGSDFGSLSIKEIRTSGTSSVNSSIVSEKEKNKKLSFIDKKNIVVLHIFLSIDFFLMNDRYLATFFEDFTNMLTVAVKNANGVIANSFGGHFFIAWNAITISLENEKKACNLALRVQHFCNQKSMESLMSIELLKNTSCGNMGCKNFQRFNICNNKLDLILLNTLKNNEYGSNILIKKECNDIVKYDYQTIQVDYDKEESFFDVVSRSGLDSQQEWMYLIEDKLCKVDSIGNEEKQKVALLINDCWKLIEKGEIEKSRSRSTNIVYDNKYSILLKKKLDELK